MKFVRYSIGNEHPRHGWLMGGHIGSIDGSLFGEFRRLEATTSLEDAKLYAPLEPSKIVCVGRNYIDHAKEHGAEVPDIPLLFLKPPSSVLDPEGAIQLPPQSTQVEHEGELAVVIGRQGKWIHPEEVNQYIFGFTIANDVTARDLQRKDGQWTRGKGFDTFCPLGPWIETEFDPSDTLITCKVNDEMRQMASTRDMVFTVSQLVAFTSSIMTLMPGDIILTGTPAGVGPLLDGDVVEVGIEGIGVLRNLVRSSEKRF
jgi:2-keto-4-pentenoate hydratase/2-oxohepta-3-ene-1,7-dioic acid hydratase in catechol pathway